MHLKRSGAYEESWPTELLLLIVVAQDMADILAEEAFNALAKLLNTIHIPLIHLPLDAGTRTERWDFFIDSEVPGNVSNEIFDHRESFHREDCDGLIQGKRVHACFASE